MAPSEHKTIVARLVLYFTTIGGLLFVASLVVWVLWNVTISTALHLEKVSALEAVGIVALVYATVSGVVFVRRGAHSYWMSPFATRCISGNAHHASSAMAKALNDSEKEKLREQIARCCPEIRPAKHQAHSEIVSHARH